MVVTRHPAATDLVPGEIINHDGAINDGGGCVGGSGEGDGAGGLNADVNAGGRDNQGAFGKVRLFHVKFDPN